MSVAVDSTLEWRLDNAKELQWPISESRPDSTPLESEETDLSSTTAIPASLESEKARRKTVRKNKVAFVAGVLHFWVCAYWLGSFPNTFYKLYSIEAFVLFPLRWKSFKKKNMHYYMFDFCYLANLLLLVHLWIFPNSSFLFRTVFAFNSGPLAWSILLFNNSMVYHSLSEVTSLFMHWCPMLVSWTLRWFPHCTENTPCEIPGTDALSGVKVSHMLLWPMLPYLAWAILYYLKLFVISSKKIHDRGYQTLYNYMLEEADFDILKRIVFRFSSRWRPLVYMCLHLLLVFISLTTCILWWNSFWAHTTFAIISTLVAAWNGAAHYFN